MSSPNSTLIFCSTNPNKIKEISEKLSKFGIKVISQKEAGFDIEIEDI